MDEKVEPLVIPSYWSAMDRVVAGAYQGTLVGSSRAESFSDWTLGAAGLALTAMLSQYGNFPSEIRSGLSTAVYWFVAAGLFAALGKVAAISASVAVAVTNRVSEAIDDPHVRAAGGLDLSDLRRRIQLPLIVPYSWIAAWAASTQSTDPLIALRAGIVAMQLQGFAVLFQVLCLFAGIVSLGVCASMNGV